VPRAGSPPGVIGTPSGANCARSAIDGLGLSTSSNARTMPAVPLCRVGALALACGVLLGCQPRPRGANDEELLWPSGAPGARGSGGHDEPRLDFSRPDPAIPTRTAIVVAPRGSHGPHGG